MVCVYCENSTKVYNSRHSKRVNGTWRRRHCKICSSSFTSVELPDYNSIWRVLKKTHDGLLEPFNRNKLYISIYKSLGHRSRALDEAEEICNTVINGISKQVKDGLITENQLKELTKQCLGNFDLAALAYYCAYYK